MNINSNNIVYFHIYIEQHIYVYVELEKYWKVFNVLVHVDRAKKKTEIVLYAKVFYGEFSTKKEFFDIWFVQKTISGLQKISQRGKIKELQMGL